MCVCVFVCLCVHEVGACLHAFMCLSECACVRLCALCAYMIQIKTNIHLIQLYESPTPTRARDKRRPSSEFDMAEDRTLFG